MRRVLAATRSRRVTLPMLSCALALWSTAACNFGSAGGDHPEVNACRVQEDCTGDAACQNGMCMARSTETPLSIALEVTPRRLANATDALPFLFAPFMVNEPIDQDFGLPAAIPIGGTIRESDVLLPTAITFTPTTVIPGVSVKSVTASTGSSSPSKDFDYVVQLFEGVEYRMLVRPTDPNHPPFRRTFVAAKDVDLTLEYSDLPKDERTFAVSNGPAGADVILSAVDRATGESVSSTATVTAGKAKLSFAPDVGHFRLDVRISASALTAKSAADACDSGSPPYPAFSITDDMLASDPNGVARIRLPDMPARISYEGTVALCKGADMAPQLVGNLPIALRSTTVLMDTPAPAEMPMDAPPGLVASYNASTVASYDADSGQLRFCVDMLPGNYDIVVTPPSSMSCSLFAENRLIKPPTEETKASGMQLSLPEAKYVIGNLQTIDAAPLKGASVEAMALGRTGTVGFADGDERVTRYNRSQQTISDNQGTFKLPVDFGSYDVVIKPPAGSGFPWQLRYDVEIGDSIDTDATPNRINMVSPVALQGTLQTTGSTQDAHLDGATVEAYALVPDGSDSMRAISIGKTTAGTDRRFLLLLPPSTQLHWDPQASTSSP